VSVTADHQRLTVPSAIRRISPEENVRLTRVGAGTPMGEVFRRYWMPVCLSEEVPTPDCPPVRLRILGEDLIAFRDTNGTVGVIDAYCAHRRAPLFFGRNEECGLRCVYHGWKYDVNGNCVDLPPEPPTSKMLRRVHLKSYPTHEAGRLVWAYMGPPEERTDPPDYEWLRVPPESVRVSKCLQSCNFLQAIEGGIDTAHVSYMHNNHMSDRNQLGVIDKRPRLEVEFTDHGFRYVGIRNVTEEQLYVRGYQYIMPNQKLQGAFLSLFGDVSKAQGDLNEVMREKVPNVYGHVWVPVDDENTIVYTMRYAKNVGDEFPEEYWVARETSSGRGPDDYIPGTFYLKKNLGNDYQIDRELQARESFTGITGINTQDVAIQEGMGPIVDRSLEFPGTTDRAICAARELLLEAAADVEAGRRPRAVDPADSRLVRAADVVIPADADWHELMDAQFTAEW
jgi:phthalate 4,5-dioxygenase